MIFLNLNERDASDFPLTSLKELISLDAASFIFKLSNNLLPEISKGYFTYNNVYHNYNTRSANNFHIPFHRTSTTQSSIFYHGTILWNNLPTSIKNSKTLTQFKRQYKNHLFDVIRENL